MARQSQPRHVPWHVDLRRTLQFQAFAPTPGPEEQPADPGVQNKSWGWRCKASQAKPRGLWTLQSLRPVGPDRSNGSTFFAMFKTIRFYW